MSVCGRGQARTEQVRLFTLRVREGLSRLSGDGPPARLTQDM